MSYQRPPPGPPPGAPQQYGPYGHPQQPPYPLQQGYGAPPGPPQGHYQPQQGHFGQPPPQNAGYHGAPAGYHAPAHQQSYGGPPQQPQYGQPPPHHAPYGQPPGPPTHGYAPPGPPLGNPGLPPQGLPPQGFPPQGFPPQGPGYGAPPIGTPSMPSLGYAPNQIAPGDFRADAEALRKAMKGFGTDEKVLISVLSRLDPLQVAAVRSAYMQHIRRDLYKDVKSEAGGYLRDGLLAVIDGPLMHDVNCANESIKGLGTKEWLMNDVLLGRSNADLSAIRTTYERTFHHSLSKDVEDDLSFKTATLFKMVLRGSRHEESTPIIPQTIDADVHAIHRANVDEVCSIFARSSDGELRAIDQAFHARHHTALEKHIERHFSGHMEDALLHMLRSATDPAMRDAILLEECMAGMGTKDDKLVIRVVRTHWNRAHKDQVKRAYRHRYGKDLIDRVRGETSGDYGKLMVALLQ
ncbi:hypothetical protein N7495_004378 [Penicillium taxi]|uniref:uncharacterized protein n=1 Tax=Penicillium taxi TaxID=168475 RepID=UPI0025456A82|nr:uncharacterized protein N7495_004378 [Penicillium taxi]KAJ5899634.1 hypothetical protein N7495_004378 [Penicillium taxi]